MKKPLTFSNIKSFTKEQLQAIKGGNGDDIIETGILKRIHEMSKGTINNMKA